MEVKTSGYGGREISESVTVFTNDPGKPALELVVSGNVKTFAKIEPKNIRLFGKAGEPVSAVVEIVPGKDTPFKIKGVRVNNGQFIRTDLSDKKREGQSLYELKVTSTRTAPGAISDVVYLDTDSELRPVLQVPVMGRITETKQ
jgi:hypothetical protein